MASPLQEALMEADRQIEQRGYVWQTLRAMTGELDRFGIPYAILGGIALQHYGLHRSTQDVHILIGSRSDLEAVHGE